MDFKKLQESMPWTTIWSEDYRNDPRPYRSFSHCLTNITAKLGAIFQRVELSDHYGMDYELGLDRHKDGKALAFIIMSAMKAANAYPGGPIDLLSHIETDLKRRKNA
jgi:hypothetical protein